MRAVLVALALTVLADPGPSLAHHAFAADFDIKKPIKLTGSVTKVEWTNPHVWFFIDVTDETGKATNWGLETSSPNALTRSGWTRSSMKAGDVVTVEGSAARDGSSTGAASVVILAATGQRLFSAAQGKDGTP